MIEILPDRFAALLPRLDAVAFNHLFARTVLERKIDGKAWVDSLENPEIFYVSHPYGMSLLFGAPRADVLPALRRLLLGCAGRERDEWLQVSPAAWDGILIDLLGHSLAPYDIAPGGPKVQRFSRLNFRFDPHRYAYLRAKPTPPDDIPVVRLDGAMFDALGQSVAPRHFWRDCHQFAAEGIGYCTLAHDVPTAAAFASFIVGRQLEIGVETHPGWRGRGHALRACVALIDHCLRNGLEPIWSCRGENIGSVRLAEKLGFVPTLELPYFRLPPTRSGRDPVAS